MSLGLMVTAWVHPLGNMKEAKGTGSGSPSWREAGMRVRLRPVPGPGSAHLSDLHCPSKSQQVPPCSALCVALSLACSMLVKLVFTICPQRTPSGSASELPPLASADACSSSSLGTLSGLLQPSPPPLPYLSIPLLPFVRWVSSPSSIHTPCLCSAEGLSNGEHAAYQF